MFVVWFKLYFPGYIMRTIVDNVDEFLNRVIKQKHLQIKYCDYLFKNQEDRLGALLTWVNSPYSRRPTTCLACMGNPYKIMIYKVIIMFNNVYMGR